MRIEALKPQHLCCDRTYDVRCHSKKQKGYTTETSIPGNAVTVLIFHIKRIN